jgi:large subunit ribosomal protein L22
MAATGQATTKYIRTSAQKAGLVLAQIRGANVDRALATLRFSQKLIARDIEKTLRSAIANAQQKAEFGGEVERLFVARAYANQGPSMKRIRPAPMGRAFRVVKRMAHLTVEVAERPVKVAAGGAAGGSAQPKRRARAAKSLAQAEAAKGE